jgi:hypothetical protein
MKKFNIHYQKPVSKGKPNCLVLKSVLSNPVKKKQHVLLPIKNQLYEKPSLVKVFLFLSGRQQGMLMPVAVRIFKGQPKE